MDIEIAYQEALDYIYSFVDYSLTRASRYTAAHYDLKRMEAFMERLGNPQRQYPVIHVAGTKGKGSIAVLTASALQKAGYRVGFYISPHLLDFAERIQVNRQPIPHSSLVEILEELKPHIEQIQHLTTFEIITALGFVYLARQKVDVAVIEVGLGGRLDATNVVSPLVSVISSLSLDHINVLGDTLAQIAGEKAGIIKPGRPIVLAPQKEEAHLVVERIAIERQAPLTRVGKDYLFAPLAHSLDNQTLFVWSAADQPLVDKYVETADRGGWTPVHLTIPLLGYHQVENAATAYATLQVARKEGLNIPLTAIQDGFSEVVWQGRFEVLNRTPLLIIDSAHNPDSALKLRLTMDDYLSGQSVILLFGVSEDKDVRGMMAELLPRVHQVITTQSVHPRAMDAEKLVELAHQFGCPARAIVPVEDALAVALEIAGQEAAAVVAAGSLFIAAAVRDIWEKMGCYKC